VDTPREWTTAEAVGLLPHAKNEIVSTVAVSADGSASYAADSIGGATSLVQFTDHGRHKHTIFTPPAGTYFGAGYSFDGRWLIFSTTTVQDVVGPWKLYAWDSAGHLGPHEFAHEDDPVPTSRALQTSTTAGKVTWAQGIADGGQAIHVFDLVSGRDRVVRQAHVGRPLFAGTTLVWPEAAAPDTPARLKALSDYGLGAPYDLPEPLRRIGEPQNLATDGVTWAWASPDFGTLYAWRTGWADSETIHTTDARHDHVEWMAVAGDLVTWTGNATYIADLRSHSFTRVTPAYGGSVAFGKAIGVGYPDTLDKGGTETDFVVKEAALPPLPNCAGWRAVPQGAVANLPTS